MKEFPHWSNILRFSKLSGQWRCYTCHIFLRQMYGVFVLSWPEFPKFPKIFRKKSGKRNINNKKVTMRRDLRTSNKAALVRYLTQINWLLLSTPILWAVKRNGKSSKTSYIQALIPSCLPNQSRSARPMSLGWTRVWNLLLWRDKRSSVHMALTQLSLNTFVTLSTDKGKSAEGNTTSQRSST